LTLLAEFTIVLLNTVFVVTVAFAVLLGLTKLCSELIAHVIIDICDHIDAIAGDLYEEVDETTEDTN